MKAVFHSRASIPRAAMLAICLAAPAAAAEEAKQTLLPGTRFATPYYVYEGKQPGPVVIVIGGMHGDEPAGTAAADEIRHWTVARGRLIVIPRVNATAVAAGRRRTQGVDESLSDLNRNFPRAGKKEPARGAPATEIWRFVQQQKPFWLVDLHESRSLHGTQTGAVGNSLLGCTSEEMSKVAPVLARAVNASITDPQRRFRLGRQPKDGTLARAVGEHLHLPSLIVETTKADQPLALRVGQHAAIVRALLKHLGMEPGK